MTHVNAEIIHGDFETTHGGLEITHGYSEIISFTVLYNNNHDGNIIILLPLLLLQVLQILFNNLVAYLIDRIHLLVQYLVETLRHLDHLDHLVN